MTVQTAHVEGRTLFLHLNGVRTRDEAEALRGAVIEIDAEDAVPLPEGRFYIQQILGMTVADESGVELGTVVEVLPTGGANDVYVVQGPTGEMLIPAITDVIRDISADERRMTVALLPGMEPSLPGKPRPRVRHAARRRPPKPRAS